MKGFAKLFSSSGRKLQKTIAGCGIVLGTFMFLLSFQIYNDFHSVLESGDKRYFILNKKVNLLQTLSIGSSTFSKKEIKKLEKLEAVNKVAGFESNKFRLVARKGGAMNFMTEMYCEAVPSEFIEEVPSEFKWEKDQRTVPIVISTKFYNLYNFGFATSQGFPQIPKSAISNFRFDLQLSKGDEVANFKARIVGFTDRINSVLVPQEFLSWANENIANEKPGEPSRLIVEVTDIENEELRAYLKKTGYETDRDKFASSNFSKVAKGSLVFINILGFIFFVLSLIILLMSYQMLILENAQKIRQLYELGYNRDELIAWFNRSLVRKMIVLFIGGLLLYVAATVIAHILLVDMGLELPYYPDWRVLLVALLLIISLIKLVHWNLKNWLNPNTIIRT